MSLNEKLREMSRKSAAKLPEESRDVIRRFIQSLKSSGILDEVVGPGDPLPAFALPDTSGNTVRSRDLLARGPLAVTFYRGVW